MQMQSRFQHRQNCKAQTQRPNGPSACSRILQICLQEPPWIHALSPFRWFLMVSFRLSTGCSDLSWLGMRLWKMFEHCLHSRGFASLIFDTLSHFFTSFHIFSHLFTSFHMIHLSISIVPYSWGVLPLGSTFGMQLLACHCSLGPFVTKRKLPSNLLVESRYLARSSDPESHPKVGFESVSGFGFRRLKPTFAVGFGFRVSGFVAWNQLSLSVSGFGFRVSSIETHFRCRFRVSGFGFRVSSIETHFRCRFRVSVFGFRVSSLETNFRCRFRVSGFVDWNPLSLSVSGFGFRVSIGPGELKSSESVSGFGFRVSIGPGEVKSSESVSGFAGRNQLCRPLSGSRLLASWIKYVLRSSWIKYVLRSFGMFLMEEEWQDSITISSNVDRIVWLRRNSEYEMNKSLHNEFICKWVELDEINYLSLCYWQSVHGCLSFARRWTPGWLKRHWRCWEVALGRTSNQTTSCHLPAISLPHCNLLISP